MASSNNGHHHTSNPVSMTSTSPPQNESSSETETVTSSKIMSATSSSQPNQSISPILKLPLELRNLIYRFALISVPLRTHRYYHHWFMSNLRAVAAGSSKQQLVRPSSSPSFNLLLTNRQIYTEASSILFSEGCFLLPVFVFYNSLMEIFTPSPQGKELQQAPLLLEWVLRDEKWSRSITHLELEFGVYGFYVPQNHPSKPGDNVRESFSPLEAVLARFVHLRTTIVTWQTYEYIKPVDMEDSRYHVYLPRAPQLPNSKHWSLKLLEKLSAFERSRPAVKIMVRRPAGEEERMGEESESEAAEIVRLGEIVGELRECLAREVDDSD
ncbi:hypothetical protein BDR22DRAFT_594873 [Usnea florida]